MGWYPAFCFAATFPPWSLYLNSAMPAPPDRDLIVRALRGSHDAFGELVTRYQVDVFNVCYRILHERGEAASKFRRSM